MKFWQIYGKLNYCDYIYISLFLQFCRYWQDIIAEHNIIILCFFDLHALKKQGLDSFNLIFTIYLNEVNNE
jgi:hypothetical protein